MIIVAPTGLYKSILPKENESGNITYTLSAKTPPRPFISVGQLPIIERITPAPEKIFDEETRRDQFGKLVFSVARSNKNIADSTKKAFEVGEILSFENLTPIEEIVTVKAPEDVNIQHNTNLLDLENLGLTEDEIKSLESQSEAKQLELEQRFLDAQNLVKSLQVDIVETQKKINENNKVLKAVRGLLEIEDNETSEDPIFIKLNDNKNKLEEELESLILERNAAAVNAADIYEDLNRVSELVR